MSWFRLLLAGILRRTAAVCQDAAYFVLYGRNVPDIPAEYYTAVPQQGELVLELDEAQTARFVAALNGVDYIGDEEDALGGETDLEDHMRRKATEQLEAQRALGGQRGQTRRWIH